MTTASESSASETAPLIRAVGLSKHFPIESSLLRRTIGHVRAVDRVDVDIEAGKTVGLVGDTWAARRSSRTSDGSPHPDMQLNLMNARVVALLAQQRERWPLAGDQLFVDLDLSEANLPAGTTLVAESSMRKRYMRR